MIITTEILKTDFFLVAIISTVHHNMMNFDHLLKEKQQSKIYVESYE